MEFNMNFLNYQIQSWARVIIFSRGGVMFGVVWGAKGGHTNYGIQKFPTLFCRVTLHESCFNKIPTTRYAS